MCREGRGRGGGRRQRAGLGGGGLSPSPRQVGGISNEQLNGIEAALLVNSSPNPPSVPPPPPPLFASFARVAVRGWRSLLEARCPTPHGGVGALRAARSADARVRRGVLSQDIAVPEPSRNLFAARADLRSLVGCRG